MSTSDTTTPATSGPADALPDYAPVPPSSFGPALNEQGYYVGRVERNLYWVTDGVYQAAFLTTHGRRRPLRCPAEHRAQPPASDRRDRTSQRREQQGDPPGPHPPPRGPRGRILDLRQGRRADRARGDPAAPAPGRRPGPTGTGGDLQRPPDPGDRRRADRARMARRQPHAGQQRHPLSRARRADDGRHRERGLGARVRRQSVRRHPGLPGHAGRPPSPIPGRP